MIDQKTYMQEYGQKNRERLSAYKSAWRKKRLETDPEYRNKINELQAALRARKENPEQKAKAAIRTALWKKANPGRVIANTTRRKKYIKIRTPKWLTEIDFERMQTQYQLAALLTKLTNSPWEVDHAIPLLSKKVSGLHTPSNLRVIPRKDNLAKSNRFEV